MRQNFFFDATLRRDVVFRSQWTPQHQRRRISSQVWFASTETGSWALLTNEEDQQLRSIALEDSLYLRLEALGVILTGKNATEIAAQKMRWTEPHYRHPVHHIIVSTLRCNLSCTYCHAPVVSAAAGPSYDLSAEKAEQILAFALKSKSIVQSFEFQGGESLLNMPLLEQLIPRIKEAYQRRGRKVYLSVQTNGTLLNNRKMSFFKEHNVYVGTSYDGQPLLHDQNRVTNKGKPSSTRVLQMIETYNLPSLPTVTKQSIAQWQIIIDHQLAAGGKVVTMQPVYPINSARKNWNLVGVEDEQFLRTYADCIGYLKSIWRDDYYPMERRMVLAFNKLAKIRDVDFADFGSPCGMVHSQLLYDFNGDIYTCDEGRDFPEFKIGNVESSSYDEVVFGARTRHLKSLSLPLDEECGSCAYQPYCSSCPVYQRAVEGHLSATHAGTRNCLHTKLIFDTLLAWIAESPDLLMKVATYHGIAIGTHWSRSIA